MRFIRTRLLQIMVDALVVCLALTLAYAIRFEGTPPGLYRKQFLLVMPYLVLLRLGVFAAFGGYRLVWRFVFSGSRVQTTNAKPPSPASSFPPVRTTLPKRFAEQCQYFLALEYRGTIRTMSR